MFFPDAWLTGWPLSRPERVVSMPVKRCFLAPVSSFEERELRGQHRHGLGSAVEMILAPYDCRIFFFFFFKL